MQKHTITSKQQYQINPLKAKRITILLDIEWSFKKKYLFNPKQISFQAVKFQAKQIKNAQGIDYKCANIKEAFTDKNFFETWIKVSSNKRNVQAETKIISRPYLIHHTQNGISVQSKHTKNPKENIYYFQGDNYSAKNLHFIQLHKQPLIQNLELIFWYSFVTNHQYMAYLSQQIKRCQQIEKLTIRIDGEINESISENFTSLSESICTLKDLKAFKFDLGVQSLKINSMNISFLCSIFQQCSKLSNLILFLEHLNILENKEIFSIIAESLKSTKDLKSLSLHFGYYNQLEGTDDRFNFENLLYLSSILKILPLFQELYLEFFVSLDVTNSYAKEFFQNMSQCKNFKILKCSLIINQTPKSKNDLIESYSFLNILPDSINLDCSIEPEKSNGSQQFSSEEIEALHQNFIQNKSIQHLNYILTCSQNNSLMEFSKLFYTHPKLKSLFLTIDQFTQKVDDYGLINFSSALGNCLEIEQFILEIQPSNGIQLFGQGLIALSKVICSWYKLRQIKISINSIKIKNSLWGRMLGKKQYSNQLSHNSIKELFKALKNCNKLEKLNLQFSKSIADPQKEFDFHIISESLSNLRSLEKVVLDFKHSFNFSFLQCVAQMVDNFRMLEQVRFFLDSLQQGKSLFLLEQLGEALSHCENLEFVQLQLRNKFIENIREQIYHFMRWLSRCRKLFEISLDIFNTKKGTFEIDYARLAKCRYVKIYVQEWGGDLYE